MSTSKNPWDERYSSAEYVYGKLPNQFFKQQLDKLAPGVLLLPAEGEGRNAVYAASRGWRVEAMDSSTEARSKALALAAAQDVEIHYQTGNLLDLDYPENSFDCIALIFAHFQPEIRSAYHQKLATLLRPGGTLLLEAFSEEHAAYQKTNPNIGGPRQLEYLFSCKQLQNDFSMLSITHLQVVETSLSEGALHQGVGSVVHLLATKQQKP